MENSSQLKVCPCLFSTPVCCITFQSARSGLTIQEREEREREGGREEGRKKEREGWRDKRKKKITFPSATTLSPFPSHLSLLKPTNRTWLPGPSGHWRDFTRDTVVFHPLNPMDMFLASYSRLLRCIHCCCTFSPWTVPLPLCFHAFTFSWFYAFLLGADVWDLKLIQFETLL